MDNEATDLHGEYHTFITRELWLIELRQKLLITPHLTGIVPVAGTESYLMSTFADYPVCHSASFSTSTRHAAFFSAQSDGLRAPFVGHTDIPLG
jgi:hypothetical protein